MVDRELFVWNIADWNIVKIRETIVSLRFEKYCGV